MTEDTLGLVASLIRRKLCLVAVFTAVAMLCSCSSFSSTKAPSNSSKQRKPAPDFTLRDADGSSVKLSDYRGKVVLLNFWATWCGPCTLEIPWFIDFEQQFKTTGFEVLGVSMDEEGWTAVKPYIAQHKMTYRVLLGDDSVGQLYGGVESLPTSFIIDRDGKIASVHVGLAERNEYMREIQDLLGEKQSSIPRGDVRAFATALVAGPAN